MTASAHADQARSTDPQVARLIEKVKTRGNLSAADIGQAVGVGTRQVQNWASGHGTPATHRRLRQLLDLEYVLELVADIYGEEGAPLWLHARNRQLGGERPWDLIAADETDRVIELLDHLADGNF